MAGPPLREDALRQRAPGPHLPARVAGHRRGPVPADPDRDRRLRARDALPPGGRPVLRRGRRLAPGRGRPPRRGGRVLHVDPGPGARRAHRRRAPRARRGRPGLVGHHRGRELRGRLHPVAPVPPRRAGPPARGRRGPPAPAGRTRAPAAARTGRQGADRVERALPGGARRRREGHRPRRLAGRGRGDRRVPGPPPAPGGRPLAPLLAARGRREAPGLRRRPRRAGRRVPDPVRGHRPPALARRGQDHGRVAAVAVLGPGRRRLDDRRRRRGARRAAQGRQRQRHPRRQQPRGGQPAAPRGPHGRHPLRRPGP